MTQPKQSWTLDRVINSLLYIGGIILAYFVFRRLSPYLTPFFLALVTAFVLEPVVQFLLKRMRLNKRPLAVFVTLLCVGVVIYVISRFIGPAVSEEVVKFKYLIGEYTKESKLNQVIPEFLNDQMAFFFQHQDLHEILRQEDIQDAAKRVLEISWKGIGGLASFVGSMFVVVAYCIYLIFTMLQYEYFKKNWQSAIPPLYRENAVMLVKDMLQEMKGYFRGQSQVVLILIVLFATGFKLIGLPLGILLGVVVGLFNFVPYLQTLGIPLALMLAGLKAMETGHSYWHEASLAFLVFVVVQVIQETLLTPNILSKTMKINPALILLSLSIWGGLFGLLGMIIALPATSLIMNYYRRFVMNGSREIL